MEKPENIRALSETSFPISGMRKACFDNEFGNASFKQQVSYFTTHEQTHLSRIGRLREQFKAN